jgi:8-oxo-dGTP pyrophosphatase MutT (NUDIX family)
LLYYPQKFPDKKVKIAGIVIFHDPSYSPNPTSKEVLLLEKHNGKYDLPKGHVEEGETFLEGALRECCEETGLHHHKNLDVYPYHYISVPSKKWLRFYLGFTPIRDIQLSNEHYDYHWVTPRKAKSLLGPDNQFSHIIEAMDALSPDN